MKIKVILPSALLFLSMFLLLNSGAYSQTHIPGEINRLVNDITADADAIIPEVDAVKEAAGQMAAAAGILNPSKAEATLTEFLNTAKLSLGHISFSANSIGANANSLLAFISDPEIFHVSGDVQEILNLEAVSVSMLNDLKSAALAGDEALAQNIAAAIKDLMDRVSGEGNCIRQEIQVVRR